MSDAVVLRTREHDRPRGPIRFARSPELPGSHEWIYRAVSLSELGGFEAAFGGRVAKVYHSRSQQVAEFRDHRVHGVVIEVASRLGERIGRTIALDHRDDPSSEREASLYREELRRLLNEGRNEDLHPQAQAGEASTHVDEAIALAHPVAFRLLGWLNQDGEIELQRVFDAFDASSSTFEGIARLHLMGAVRFDHGKISITSLGNEILRAFGIVGRE